MAHTDGVRRSAGLTRRELIVSSLAAAGASRARPASGVQGAVVDVAFAFRTRQPIVPVSVNGGPALPFVIDTGASIHVIDREAARAAQVPAGRTTSWRGGGAATVDAQFVDDVTLTMAGRAWTAQRSGLAALGFPDRKHFAGLLGAPILTRYVVQFDFPATRLRLFEPGAFVAPSGATRLPFELMDDLPVVHVTVDAGTGPLDARVMVDTGAGTFIDLNRPFVEAHDLVAAMPDAAAADRPAALGGPAPFLYATGRRVVLAGHAFEMPRLGLSRSPTGSSSRAERDGILGNDLLQAFVVTVDYARRTLLLQRSGA